VRDTPPWHASPFSWDTRLAPIMPVSPFFRYETRLHNSCLPFSSLETKQLPDSVECPSETAHKGLETAHTSKTKPRHQMSIFSHIEHISHKYPMKVKLSHKWSYFHTLSIFNTNVYWKSNFHTNGYIFTYWAYFTQISNESQIFTQMDIFSHIEHILHNHFTTFCCGHGFLKILTFSWWSLHKYGTSLADGILGLIIEVKKGGISSNWANSSSLTWFSTLMIHHFLGIITLSLLFVVSRT
jgi:hypothetical protein